MGGAVGGLESDEEDASREGWGIERAFAFGIGATMEQLATDGVDSVATSHVGSDSQWMVDIEGDELGMLALLLTLAVDNVDGTGWNGIIVAFAREMSFDDVA